MVEPSATRGFWRLRAQAKVGAVRFEEFDLIVRPKAGLPGAYTIQRGEKTVFAVATAVPGMESDLTPMDPAVLSTRLAGGRSVHFQSAGQEPPKDDAWTWLLVGCCVCMISELAVLKAFRT